MPFPSIVSVTNVTEFHAFDLNSEVNCIHTYILAIQD